MGEQTEVQGEDTGEKNCFLLFGAVNPCHCNIWIVKLKEYEILYNDVGLFYSISQFLNEGVME